MPKKAAAKGGAKGGKGKGKGDKGDGPEIPVATTRKIKAEIAKICQDLQIGPELELEKIFYQMMYASLETKSGKMIFQGDKPGPVGINALTLTLKELCPVHVPIKTLCFWRTMVGDQGLEQICRNCLPKKKTETWPGFVNLELFDVRISPMGCEYLASGLRENIPLKTLVLDFNAIGDRGVTLLAEGLRNNKELISLSLGYCQIGPLGGSVIGNEIIRCAKIKHLKLGGNRIMAPGLIAISRNLGKTETLVEMDLSDNSILADNLALNALCEALRTNVSLQEVNLEHNVIEHEGAAMFMDTLQMCPNIKLFKISGQGVGKEVYKEVFKDGKGAKKKGKKGKKKK